MYCRAFSAAMRSPSSSKSAGSGTFAPSGTPWPGLVPQVTNGVIVEASSTISLSNSCASSSVTRRLPVLDRGVPVGALRRLLAALDVVEGRLVGGDQAGLGAPLDRHVADGHPGLHRELLDGLAAVLDDVALPAARARVGDEREHQVLGGHAAGRLPLIVTAIVLGLACISVCVASTCSTSDGADAERDRAERAVRAGVAVAADDRHAGLGQAELRADHVHDALLDVAERVQADAELLGVATQRLDLGAGDGVGDRLVPVERGDVVVLGGEGEVGAAHGAAGEPQPVERLRRGHLVDEVEVDVEEVRLTLGGSDDVLVPDLLGQGLAHDCLPLLQGSCAAARNHSADYVTHPTACIP